MRTGKQYGTVSKVNSLGIIELERDEGDNEFHLTIIPYSLILDAVQQAEGDSNKFWALINKRAFTEKISPTDGKYADTERDYLDEAEFPFENLTLRQFVNLASAYKKSA